MTMFLLQSLIWLLVAFLLGYLLGRWLKPLFCRQSVEDTDTTTATLTGTATTKSVAAPTTGITATTRDIDPHKPILEVDGTVSDSSINPFRVMDDLPDYAVSDVSIDPFKPIVGAEGTASADTDRSTNFGWDWVDAAKAATAAAGGAVAAKATGLLDDDKDEKQTTEWHGAEPTISAASLLHDAPEPRVTLETPDITASDTDVAVPASNIDPRKPIVEVEDAISDANINPFKPIEEVEDAVSDSSINPFRAVDDLPDYAASDANIDPFKSISEVDKNEGLDWVDAAGDPQETPDLLEAAENHQATTAADITNEDEVPEITAQMPLINTPRAYLETSEADIENVDVEEEIPTVDLSMISTQKPLVNPSRTDIGDSATIVEIPDALLKSAGLELPNSSTKKPAVNTPRTDSA